MLNGKQRRAWARQSGGSGCPDRGVDTKRLLLDKCPSDYCVGSKISEKDTLDNKQHTTVHRSLGNGDLCPSHPMGPSSHLFWLGIVVHECVKNSPPMSIGLVALSANAKCVLREKATRIWNCAVPPSSVCVSMMPERSC
ncbi:hypothetical protein CEXT_548821 [Caerostris extrusa]|uniref:Uncharacterized protein n=1 Tax=Caerostris extrusa TaxID=172846 RepID=A0AAV4XLV4_CAEEX|nr:hypothetical protein CEXT_548821 [Caerostris extrusa]